MSNNVLPAGSPWSAFSGPNLGYVMEQYDLFLQSPEEVEPELVAVIPTIMVHLYLQMVDVVVDGRQQ